jgi:hypothetical protein
MKKNFLLTTINSLSLVLIIDSSYAATYLDGSAIGCINGSVTYSPATRTCGSGSDTVYVDLAGFETGIVAGNTNYMRAGNYWRDASSGSLRIGSNKSGSSGSPTIIKAYPGEERQVVLGTNTRKNTYNSNPGDTGSTGSDAYYPNEVIYTYDASYVTIDGVKTYGQVILGGGHDVTLKNSDVGGGGPSEYQGNVVKLNNTYNALVENNLIHHSCWGENPENGSAIIFYSSSATIKNNTFYDNYGYDIFVKASLGQSGRTTEISHNLFLPSSIYAQVGGIRGHNQSIVVSRMMVHNNIFIKKYDGYNVLGAPATNIVYNNTFINNTVAITSPASGAVRPLSVYNNIFYSTASSNNFITLYSNTGYLTDADWNLYYTNGKWGKTPPGATDWATTLPGWRSYISKDTNSVSNINPNFIDANGSDAASFKRSSYGENFTGSSYGTRAGAYVTGNEIIGFNSTTAPAPITAPAPTLILIK